MNQATYNSLRAHIWNIATDCLVDVYDVGDYRKIILPMFVIRRFDAVLEPVHDKLVEMRKKLEQLDDKSVDIEPALCSVAGQAFVNSSDFTLNDLKSRTNRQQLKADFINYLDGFSKNIQDIIDKFHIRFEIDRLSDNDRLGLLIEKLVDPKINLSNEPVLNEDGSVKIEALDNHSMGTLFEDVIRQFNESTNVTDAGRHFTPRDIVSLMADLAFVPVQDKIQSTAYRIYDGACGTGGMLTVGEQRIQELAAAHGKKVTINLFGQELADETFAIARSDMLVKGAGAQANNIRYGSTISNDQFLGEEFDFELSNPPFGTSWKNELKAWGISKKEDIPDGRFIIMRENDKGEMVETSLVPDIGDPQMLFLANNISKMKRNTELGSRIVEVHNGSSLFTGDAGSGSSNLRQYMFEKDLVEAIVALPEKMFYNTGIGTYLWILSNKKEPNRRGKVQLIDATEIKSPVRKNLGEKNAELSESDRKKILNLYMAFEDADNVFSKVFDNKEFGYQSVDILRPLRLRVELSEKNIAEFKSNVTDEVLENLIVSLKKELGKNTLNDYNKVYEKLMEIAEKSNVKLSDKRIKLFRNYFATVDENAEAVKTKAGLEADKSLTDTEKVPLLYEGGIKSFFEKEVKPYVQDAWVDEDSIVTGYELSFTKYFYKPVVLRDVKDIVAEINDIEKSTAGLLESIIGE